ncbi:conserved membrane hypothetical protein [Microbacterium sp. 8M]|uniref:DUF2231 domain-containing protein n=1 Tax=Microbacterium sp. 8M TaxID=2653153 RepID=UPI0012F2B1D6|nr:DUF2231 domain-containing protein [Microbacterium sp. 8M]VXC01638.1 conserved membrane hypothetical protein [Microbacterium sp. 8M]
MTVFLASDPYILSGLPLHPLLVHATVILTPATALAVALAAVWPAARRRLGVATPIAAALVAVLVPVTVLAGLDLAAKVGSTPAIQHHGALGLLLIPWSIALLLAAVAVHLRERIAGRIRRAPVATAISVAITVAAIICATGTMIVVVLTGEAGARAVWGGIA